MDMSVGVIELAAVLIAAMATLVGWLQRRRQTPWLMAGTASLVLASLLTSADPVSTIIAAAALLAMAVFGWQIRSAASS